MNKELRQRRYPLDGSAWNIARAGPIAYCAGTRELILKDGLETPPKIGPALPTMSYLNQEGTKV